MENILKKAVQTHALKKDEIVSLLKDENINKALFKAADSIRQEFTGDEVHLRGLIEFSNICKRGCKYCGLQSLNKEIERYRISPEEIVLYAKQAANTGYKTIVLQSGEDDYFSVDKMCKIITEIKNLNVALTLSIGEKTKEEYRAYKNAGADRYLLRIETTDEALYSKMHPNMDFKKRRGCLYNLKELEFETGSGSLVGLPGQTLESLAEDILFFKELNADMIGIGPFIPHPNTPLKNTQKGDFTLALKVMAITRLLLPDINIPATTAMETIYKEGRIIALQSGANVVMPNVTISKYRKKYEIYPGKICTNDDETQCRKCIEEKIISIGRKVSNDFGFRKKY